MTKESFSSPAERYCSPEKAKGLRIAVDDLVTNKGFANGFHTDSEVSPPEELFIDFPEVHPSGGDSDNAAIPSYRVIARQLGNVITDHQRVTEEATLVAVAEIIRSQWVHLDKPDPVNGNKESSHALYVISAETAPGLDEPLYSVCKIVASNNSSMALMDLPRTENLPVAVTSDEADALIGYFVDLKLDSSSIDMSYVPDTERQ